MDFQEFVTQESLTVGKPMELDVPNIKRNYQISFYGLI